MRGDPIFIRVLRTGGSEVILRAPGASLQRAMDRANAEFGNIYAKLGGPDLPPPEKPKGRR